MMYMISGVSMDWFKRKLTGKHHISWENRWFPVGFRFNQSIQGNDQPWWESLLMRNKKQPMCGGITILLMGKQPWQGFRSCSTSWPGMVFGHLVKDAASMARSICFFCVTRPSHFVNFPLGHRLWWSHMKSLETLSTFDQQSLPKSHLLFQLDLPHFFLLFITVRIPFKKYQKILRFVIFLLFLSRPLPMPSAVLNHGGLNKLLVRTRCH